MPGSYRHTIIFDDSLHPAWTVLYDDSRVDPRHNFSVKGTGSTDSCSRSLQLLLARPLAHVRLKTKATIQESTQLSLQFWARGLRGVDAYCSRPSIGSSVGWACSSIVCLSLRRSATADSTARFVPLCAFGGPAAAVQHGWRKFIVPTSPFSSGAGGFDEIVLMAGAASQGRALEVLLDDVVLVHAGKPPSVIVARQPRSRPAASTPGWCEYMAPWNGGRARLGRLGAGAAASQLPCRVADGDHLRGRWVQNCHPEAIRRPDRYAYGASLARTHGQWDYRVCFRMSYAERERSRHALTWTWQPESCTLPKVDGARFSRWLGQRTLLFWGDSLSAQHFYALVLLLGPSVLSLLDHEAAAAEGIAAEALAAAAAAQQQPSQPQSQSQPQRQHPTSHHAQQHEHACDYEGLGNEGGPLTEARLEHGGRIVKVLGHAEMAAQLQDMEHAWWLPLWRAADVVVFNPVGHHLRTLPQAFHSGWYRRLVMAVLPQLARHTKPTAWLVLRTSNVGHHGCERAAEPLATRADAWRALGGWRWRPAAKTPAYFGAPRDGLDKYDWRAPPLHEHLWAHLGAASPFGARLVVLNVSHVDQRSDGHVAAAMAAHWDPHKASTPGRDCLHYCFPGPADAWAIVLYSLLLHHPRGRSDHGGADGGADGAHARAPRASLSGRRLQLEPVETGAVDPTRAADRFAACAPLVACERAGRVWKGRLMSAAADGHWTVPCVQAHPAEATACARALRRSRRREGLLVFTHLPKAGGSSFGAMLTRAQRGSSSLEACRLLWNGLEPNEVCPRVREWLSLKAVQLAPLLPLTGSTGLGGHNATLVSAVPFRHCGSLWAQHVDYSIVEAIKDAHPQLRVRPMMLVRHPATLFFSEFLYKKHCLWRQQGLTTPPPSASISLAQHIERLRQSPGRQTLLTRFLAGASWCSCSADRLGRRQWSIHELRRRARRNAAAYAFIGVLERYNESMHVLRQLLAVDGIWQTHRKHEQALVHTSARSNTLNSCVSPAHVPSSDMPTVEQRADVLELLHEDVQLYHELERRLLQMLEARMWDEP